MVTCILQGCVETVRKLLTEGADPNTKDHAGWTPLVSDLSQTVLLNYKTDRFQSLCQQR